MEAVAAHRVSGGERSWWQIMSSLVEEVRNVIARGVAVTGLGETVARIPTVGGNLLPMELMVGHAFMVEAIMRK